jgi:hypothetical protein
MFYFNDTELAEMIDRWSRDIDVSYWWYRDVILQAQERGLVKVIAHTEDCPFWWRKFADSIELSDKIKELIMKNRQRDIK